MSSPHVAGAAALLTDLKPDWDPGRIESALMTTAHQGVLKEDSTTKTDPFDDGSGRIDLARANSPGITFSSLASTYFLHVVSNGYAVVGGARPATSRSST